MALTYSQVIKLQKMYDRNNLQKLINSGLCWKLEGSIGRAAMQSIETGECMLSKERKVDFYGNTIPSRYDVKEGTKGSFKHCQIFWSKVDNGEIFLD